MSTLSPRNLEPILAVAAKLAAPFDLSTLLAEIVAAAKQVLAVTRGTVWLYDRDADELVLRFAEDVPPLRIPAGKGIVGSCARARRLINVPDCYADPRFDPTLDRRLGFRTICMLAVPLIDHVGELVGVMLLLNKPDGFDASDEAVATALAAQCAVALQRVRMTEALVESEKLRRELEMARIVQMSTLPATMPVVEGYDIFGASRPADLTGGDTFDLARVAQGVLVTLGDATGHGIGPALSVTQMQAMLRMAFRLGADLETAFVQANNQLAEAMPGDRFITAFVGLLDPAAHRLRFHSGGQGPIVHFSAATGAHAHYKPTSFPLAAMPMTALEEPAVALDLAPGDILVVISDGVYEQPDAAGEAFGEERVLEVVRAHHTGTMAALAARIFDAVRDFAGALPAEDDMTIVLVKRAAPARRAFERRIEAIADLFAFTAETFAAREYEADARASIDLALEELFTNMVKYGNSSAPIVVEIATIPGGIEVALVEDGAARFDPTRAPEVDIEAPIERRIPGGLGVHLVRRLMDAFEYRYLESARQGRTMIRKMLATAKKDGNAGD